MSWLILAVVSLIFSGLFSGMEIAFITSDRVRIGLDVSRGGIINSIIGRYYSNQQFFISTILVGNNIMLVIYGMGAAALLEPWIEAHVTTNQALILTLQSVISTLVILFTGEFLPKSIFRINPYTSLKLFALPTYIFYIVLFPVSWLTARLSHLLMRLAGIKSETTSLGVLSINELNDYLEKTIDDVENPAEATVENEVKIFHNALDFSKTPIRDCMVPRNELVAVDIDDTSRADLSRLFTSSGRSKIIVYRHDIDNILGYIHVSELFRTSARWQDSVKPALFCPETLLADTMMRRMLSEKKSMAIIIDEFGGTAGMATLEDLVEEIFGDIQDEHDKSRLTAVETAPGEYDFSGRIEIRYLRDNFRLPIPESDDYQTLAGYILFNVGSIPAQDEQITIDDITFTIRRRSATRLDLIHLSCPTADADGAK